MTTEFEGVEDAAPASPRIVAFGGGTGMSVLLAGLKPYSSRITAVVTVTDNGGSSGRLRKEFDMVPPGDIRNCLVALAEGDPRLRDLVRYRFEESDLKGHNLGNLMITALTRITGSFDEAVRELNRMLCTRGQVLPATGHKISLIAHHTDGTKSTGEVQISRSGKRIERVEIRPRVATIASDVDRAIREADLMIFGPGSLFTSVIPNLLVEGIREAIAASDAPKLYIANIMSQPGETTDFTLRQHLDAIEAHAGREFLSAVVTHDGAIPQEILDRYRVQGAFPVEGLAEVCEDPALEVVTGELLDSSSTSVRHDANRLATLVAERFLSKPTKKTV